MTQADSGVQVSVVLATYNSARDITATLQSIVRQTLDCIREIVVVDDASTDNSRELVTAFGDPRIRLLALDTNQGVSRAHQIGMEAARFEWIAFNDADDVWLDDKLERQFALLNAHPEAVACVGGNGRLHRDGRRPWCAGFGRWRWCPQDNPRVPEPPFFRPVLDGHVYLQSLLVRREVALREAFKPELTLMQDQDYMLRLGCHGRFVITECPVFLYRLGFSNTTAPGRMRARVFLANPDYLYRATEAFVQGTAEPDVAAFLRDHEAVPEEIDAFEVAQRFRYFNTVWVQRGLVPALLALLAMFVQHPLQTARFIARRLRYWRRR